jgi:hypothetical protein
MGIFFKFNFIHIYGTGPLARETFARTPLARETLARGPICPPTFVHVVEVQHQQFIRSNNITTLKSIISVK